MKILKRVTKKQGTMFTLVPNASASVRAREMFKDLTKQDEAILDKMDKMSRITAGYGLTPRDMWCVLNAFRAGIEEELGYKAFRILATWLGKTKSYKND